MVKKYTAMKLKGIAYLTLVLILLIFYACNSSRKEAAVSPVKIIFDSDFGPDYDDVGALTILHALADSGKAEILATIASNKYALVAPSMEVLNIFYGRPEIPIGSPKSKGVNNRCLQQWTDSLVARYPHTIDSTAQTQDAVILYRKILASQPDTSVVIVTVGFLTNLRDLLISTSDSISPLTGHELVAKKVKKLVSMAGKFPEGMEYNVKEDSVASKYTFENWPTKILFSGFEIGEKILTGIELVNSAVQNPAKDVFRISIPLSAEDKNGRMSWDETAVLVSVLGAEVGFTEQFGTIQVDNSGYNLWMKDSKGKHSFLVFEKTPEQIRKIVEQYMMHQAVKK